MTFGTSSLTTGKFAPFPFSTTDSSQRTAPAGLAMGLALPPALLQLGGKGLILDPGQLGKLLGAQSATFKLLEQAFPPGHQCPHPTQHIRFYYLFTRLHHQCHPLA